MSHARPHAFILPALVAGIALALGGCVTAPTAEAPDPGVPLAQGRGLDDLVLVDCRLPGQIRQLGARMTFIGPRRAIKTTKSDCGIRGGEFVLFDRSDYGTALATLLPRAEAGDPVAQTYVGEIYEKGLGLPAPDPARAAFWYRKAAESGHRPAQTNLGSLYERGAGVPQDRRAALDWYRRGVGLDQDRVVFESALNAERQAFQREIALRNSVATSLRQQLRQASASRPAPVAASPAPVAASPAPAQAPARVAAATQATPVATPAIPVPAAPVVAPPVTAPVTAQAAPAPRQIQKIAESQRLETDSEVERLRRELHAVEQLKASEAKAAPTPEASARSAQLGKLELTRNEQYHAMLDTSRRLSALQ